MCQWPAAIGVQHSSHFATFLSVIFHLIQCFAILPTFTVLVFFPLYLFLSVFRLRRKKVVVSVNAPSTAEEASSTDHRYA